MKIAFFISELSLLFSYDTICEGQVDYISDPRYQGWALFYYFGRDRIQFTGCRRRLRHYFCYFMFRCPVEFIQCTFRYGYIQKLRDSFFYQLICYVIVYLYDFITKIIRKRLGKFYGRYIMWKIRF